MRILHVITTADPRSGGPIEGVRQLVAPLEQRGHEVELVTTDDPDAAYVHEFPAPIHACGPVRGTYSYCPEMKRWLAAHVTEYDAVIANGIWQYGNIAARRAARRAGRPYVVYTHGMLDPYFNRRYPLKKLKKMLYWPLQERVLRDAYAVLFTCEEEKLLARQAFRPYKVNEREVSYGTSGPVGETADHRSAFRAAFPHLAEKPFLLFLSRIHPKKGVDLLLEAWRKAAAENANLQLAIAGPVDERYKRTLDQILQGNPASARVHWLGMLQGDAKWGAFREAEAFILPSHQENFGIAVAEALACACPVLITHPVNIWREIEADGAGIVRPDTPGGVADLLATWLSTTEVERHSMQEAAFRCYRNRFTIERAADSLAGVLTEMLTGRKDG